jgi:16S rRNA (cytosine967-C5)-methyltransferase
VNNAREVALQVIRDVFPAEGHAARGAQEAFDYRAGKAGLDARNRAFATELAYGAIKMRRALDWYLDPFVGERATSLPPVILEILRLGAYEFVFTRADEHATVFELVNLAKKYGHPGVAGLANAVFRSFLRDRPAPPARERFGSEDDYLGTLYSLPNWLLRLLRVAFPKELEAVCAGVNAPAQSAIVVNRLRGDVDAVASAIRNAGVDVRRSPFVEEALLANGAAYLRARERDAEGAWWIQSESSAMPVAVLNPQPGEAVLDVASGRGNKALQIGARMAAGGDHIEGTLVCIERDAKRVATLQKRLEQSGVAAGVITGDAATEVLEPNQQFDRILIDAPCSSIGIIGRHPEARWRKRPNDGERLAVVQAALLERLASNVHSGGTMVYAVCSVDPRETVEVVEAFLRTHNFSRGLIGASLAPFLTEEGDVLVPPGLEERDGFYIARLEKPT